MKGQQIQEKQVLCFIFGGQETKVICQAYHKASANLTSASSPLAKVMLCIAKAKVRDQEEHSTQHEAR